MRKIAKYSQTNKGNVVACKWDCACNHEHFLGSYEHAVKYFGADVGEIKSYGNLIGIIAYHQTSQYTVPKLSNELYNIMVYAMAEHKYWVEIKLRHQKAMEVLKEASIKGYLSDELICKTIREKGNMKALQRVYMYDIWCEKNEYNL